MALSPVGLAELQHSVMLGLRMESWGQGCCRLCCLQHLLGAPFEAVGACPQGWELKSKVA